MLSHSYRSSKQRNRQGLVNLNKIVSESHTKKFHKEPRILKQFLETHREGLLVGSAWLSR